MKTILVTLGIILTLIAVSWFILNGATPAPTLPAPTAAASGTSPTVAPSPAGTTYTMAQVAQHGSQASCWTAINGSVYDLTSYVNAHPGGAGAILSICGADGSAAFNAQHGGQGRPAQVLATLRIGALAR